MSESKEKKIECKICHKVIDLKDIVSHIKESHSDLNEEELSIFLSEHFKVVESKLDLKDATEEDVIVSKIKINGVKVWTYPPLDFYSCLITPEDENPNQEMTTFIADNEVIVGRGYLILKRAKNNADALEKLNDIVSLFNLIGIPIDFFNSTDLILLAETEKDIKMEMICSKMAFRRNSNVPLVDINFYDLTALLLSCNEIWKKFKENEFIKETRIYEFLGRARLNFFNKNYRLAFINAWIVIEAILREIWERKIIEKYGSKNITKDIRKDSRSWTINVITEELFLLDFISLEERNKIKDLRQQRNNLFHFKSVEKMKISQEMSERCIIMGLKLLIQESKAFGGKQIVDLAPIRERIYTAIHRSETIQ